MSFRCQRLILMAAFLAMPICTATAQTAGVGDPTIPDFHPIPVQNCAGIEISGTTILDGQNTPYEDLDPGLALGDNGTAVFGFYNMDSSDPDGDSYYSIYTWQNGSATMTNNIDVGNEDGLQIGNQIYPGFDVSPILTPDGNGFCSQVNVSSIDPPSGGSYTGIQLLNGSISPVSPPALTYSGSAPVALNYQYLSDSEDYGYCGGDAATILETGTLNGAFWQDGIIVYSGTTLIFDDLVAQSGGAAPGVQVVSGTFLPEQLSANGCAYGYNWTPEWYSNPVPLAALAWDGTEIVPLAPMTGPADINNIGQVVGTAGNCGYLWTSQYASCVCTLVKSGSVQNIIQLIPPQYQDELMNINPVNISGVNATDGSVRIEINAQYKAAPDAGPGPWGCGWATGQFLLTLLSGSTTTLQRLSTPSNVDFDWNDSVSSVLTPITPNLLNSSGMIISYGILNSTQGGTPEPSQGYGAMLLLPVQINAYRPQMVPNSVDLSSTDPTQMIIPQSEVSGTGVHIRVNGDSENTNLVKVTYSSPALKTMTGLSAAVQASSSNLVVWSSSNKGTCITSSNNQGNLTLDGSGNATIWVEATASGTNTLNFLIVSGTSTIGTSGSLNFVNYDSFTQSFSGETFGTQDPKTNGMFPVAQKLYLEGYNIAYYDVHTISSTSGQPAYGELSNQIQNGFVKSVGLFGHSHGGGETYNICSLLSSAGGTLGTFNIKFSGYVDAIQHVSWALGDATHNPWAETQYPPGSAYLWNYYETKNPIPHGVAIPGAAVNLNVNTTSWGSSLVHAGSNGIAASPKVQADLQSTVESNVPKY
jgi:hypothetical protein